MTSSRGREWELRHTLGRGEALEVTAREIRVIRALPVL